MIAIAALVENLSGDHSHDPRRGVLRRRREDKYLIFSKIARREPFLEERQHESSVEGSKSAKDPEDRQDRHGVGERGLARQQEKTKALRSFPAPSNALKVVHRWRYRERLPDVKELA
jgi:hypothetical protein